MSIELRCNAKNCHASKVCGGDITDAFCFGASDEYDWTWWEHWDGMTCPDHYVYGLARERVARRASDA
jgi:hypothetical protein